MIKGYIDKCVDRRLNEILQGSVEEYVSRYTREATKGAVLVVEPSSLITVPGGTNILYKYEPHTPLIMGGYIDVGAMAPEDKVEIKIELRLKKEWSWRIFLKHEFTGFQSEPLFLVDDLFVTSGVKITLSHKSGVGKKFYHVWYKRK